MNLLPDDFCLCLDSECPKSQRCLRHLSAKARMASQELYVATGSMRRRKKDGKPTKRFECMYFIEGSPNQ